MSTWDPALYDSKHAYVFGYGEQVVDMLAPQPGERILDLGCGTGHLTARIAESGATVHGVDASAEMIETAKQQYAGILFEVADARTMEFAEPFDAVFSNAALHWIHEADRVVRRIAVALRDGGRFVAEFGGKGNVGAIETGIRHGLEVVGVSPASVFPIWYFPSIGEYTQLLERKGLTVEYAALFPRTITLDDPEAGLRDWLRMFAGKAIQAVPAEQLAPFFAAVESKTRVQLHHEGAWHADYRRIRVIARKPG